MAHNNACLGRVRHHHNNVGATPQDDDEKCTMPATGTKSTKILSNRTARVASLLVALVLFAVVGR
jgi:hypothetical protein